MLNATWGLGEFREPCCHGRRRTLVRRIAFVVLLIGLLVAIGAPAAADCSGPTIEIVRRDVGRGGQLLVIGSAWGDNCYDTGPPPDGEGGLGVPIDAIEIYVVQDGKEWLVATGAADADYSFEALVVVPIALQPGNATVEARWNDRVAYSQDPQFVVSGAAPLMSAEPSVVTFDATTTTTSVASTTIPAATTATDPAAEVTSTSEVSGSVVQGSSSGGQDEARTSSTRTVPLISGLVSAMAAASAVVVVVRRRKN